MYKLLKYRNRFIFIYYIILILLLSNSRIGIASTSALSSTELSGDIATSSPVVVTHLDSPLPVSRGGTGTTSVHVNNLSDLGSPATDRTSLGLGSLATASSPLSVGSRGTGTTTASTDLLATQVNNSQYDYTVIYILLLIIFLSISMIWYSIKYMNYRERMRILSNNQTSSVISVGGSDIEKSSPIENTCERIILFDD